MMNFMKRMATDFVVISAKDGHTSLAEWKVGMLMVIEVGTVASLHTLTNPEAEFGRTILHPHVETVDL